MIIPYPVISELHSIVSFKYLIIQKFFQLIVLLIIKGDLKLFVPYNPRIILKVIFVYLINIIQIKFAYLILIFIVVIFFSLGLIFIQEC